MAGRAFTLFVGFFVFATGSAVEAAPRDGRVVEGAGSITQSGTHTDIHQNSDFLATQWGSFNIAAHESVQAHQPNSTSRLLIRVDGGGTGTGGGTNIAGSYTSNGITILENQNGVQFSRGAVVNVGGLLATSSRISGVGGNHWQLNGVGGAVVNHGQIVAGAGGAILAAVKVQNTGDITAKGGDVALGAGSSFTVDFAGSMIGFEITQAASGASIVNTGKIEAQGGVVALSAQEAQAVRTNVVSVGGVVKATKLERRGGVVYLSGGTQGIAEVSGEVQASDKVQTTGEYVVVKEGAVLTAPEILVGGDFQGGGDVQTAKRTLVEAGALLDAGAEGRVIVWSDDVTWFNGNITAPGGFAEVSGKQTLASVNLAGIDVGELLLDPADIIIAATGDPVPVSGSIVADPDGGTMTLGVASINDFTGNLTLAASNTITVEVAILKPTGNLTLTAGGILTISANITTSAGDLTLTGTDVIGMDEFELRFIATPGFVLGGDVVLTGGAINLTGTIDTGMTTRNLTINASGILTLNSGIGLGSPTPGLGALRIRAFHVNIPSAIGLNATMLRVEFTDPNAVGFLTGFMGDGARGIDLPRVRVYIFAPRGCAGADECMLALPSSNTASTALHLNPILMAETSITIDASVNDRDTGAFITFNELIFGGTGPISITAPTITINAAAINIGNRALTINANGGSLTLNTVITATADSTGAVMLSATDGALTLEGDINVADSTRAVTLSATNGALTLEGDINAAGSTGAVTLSATNGALTLRGDINAISSDIALTGTQGIDLGDINTLTGGAISLTGVIMRDTALTVTATGVLTLNSNINTGTSGLTLTGGTGGIKLGGDVELTGSTVSLTGAIDEAAASTDGLTITATGNITLNSNIDLGMGALDLRAGVGSTTGNILNGDTARTIISGALFLQQTGSFGSNLFDSATSRASGAVSLRISSAVGQEIYQWIVDLGSGDLSIQGVGGVTLTSISRPLGALTRSAGTLDLRAATVTLGPTTNATGITIIADTIVFVNLANSISATAGNVALTGTIDNSFQELTINAEQSTGSIVFNSAAIALLSLVVNSNQALEVNANGTLTLNSNINTGTSALTLTSGTGGTGGIVLGGDVVLTGAAINLTGAINETMNTRNLTITASGVLTLNSDINLGTGMAGGILTISVGARINAPNSGTDITASAININFLDFAVQTPAAGLTAGSMGNVTFSPTPTYTFTALNCVEAACRLGEGSALEVSSTLMAAASITINAGMEALTFSGTGVHHDHRADDHDHGGFH